MKNVKFILQNKPMFICVLWNYLQMTQTFDLDELSNNLKIAPCFFSGLQDWCNCLLFVWNLSAVYEMNSLKSENIFLYKKGSFTYLVICQVTVRTFSLDVNNVMIIPGIHYFFLEHNIAVFTSYWTIDDASRIIITDYQTV